MRNDLTDAADLRGELLAREKLRRAFACLAGVARARMLHLSAIVVTVFYTIAVVRYVRRSADFFGDDLIAFWQARTLPMGKYLLTPIDVHVVPLHRLVNWGIGRLFPMQFVAAQVCLVLFQLLALYFFYRNLQLLRRTPANAFFVAAYATNVYIGSLLVWWTSGLHRLPCIWLTAVGVYGYLRYRDDRKRRWAAVVVLSVVVGLGFFEKAMLIPLVLAGIEACLWTRTDAAARRVNLLLIAAAIAAVALYSVAWKIIALQRSTAIHHDVFFAAKYLALSWKMLINSLIGRTYDSFLPAACLLTLLIVGTVFFTRASLVPWLVMALVASTSMLMPAISRERAEAFGYLPAVFGHRYYPEVTFLVALFVAIAWHRVEERFEALRLGTRAKNLCLYGAPLLASAALALLATTAYQHYVAVSHDLYPDLAHHRRYIQNVRTGLNAIKKKGAPLVFVNGYMPDLPQLDGISRIPLSVLLTDFGLDVTYSNPVPGVYRIGREGKISRIPLRKKRARR